MRILLVRLAAINVELQNKVEERLHANKARLTVLYLSIRSGHCVSFFNPPKPSNFESKVWIHIHLNSENCQSILFPQTSWQADNFNLLTQAPQTLSSHANHISLFTTSGFVFTTMVVLFITRARLRISSPFS